MVSLCKTCRYGQHIKGTYTYREETGEKEESEPWKEVTPKTPDKLTVCVSYCYYPNKVKTLSRSSPLFEPKEFHDMEVNECSLFMEV